MTGRALLIEYFAPVTDAAASRRQVVAVAADIDVPARDLRRRRGAPDAIRALRLRAASRTASATTANAAMQTYALALVTSPSAAMRHGQIALLW